MGYLDSIHQRVCTPELMDNPQLDRDSHVRALRGLTRIYRVSRPLAAIWPRIRREAQAVNGPVRVLDLATGGGDLPLSLARRGQREGIPLCVDGCDISPRAIAFARLRARRSRTPVRFFTLDVSRQSIPRGYHVLTATLFLHHLAETAATHLMRNMAGATERLVLIDDLRRSHYGLCLAWLATRILTRSRVVHVDALRSVRAAFKSAELAQLAADAGLAAAEVVPHWPQRQLLVWRRG